MDGFETARYIRLGKRSRHTPILFVTAEGDDLAGALRGYMAGAVDYIAKPIQPDILRSKVRVFVELYRKGRELALQAEELACANRDLKGPAATWKSSPYTVAHELRAPLRTMSGFSQLLLEEYDGKALDAAGRQYVQRIDDGAKRMDALIRDLLAYCQVARSPADCAPLDAGSVVDNVVASFASVLRERSAEVSAGDGLPAGAREPSASESGPFELRVERPHLRGTGNPAQGPHRPRPRRGEGPDLGGGQRAGD
jgi:signal transduction histidine kinase